MIPDYQTLMLPLLKYADDRKEHRIGGVSAPAEDALKLQRPLPDGTLKIVLTGVKKDERSDAV